MFLEIRVHCPGNAQHGLLLDCTAGDKMTRVLNKFFAFRMQQKQILKEEPNLTIGDIITINLTNIEVGNDLHKYCFSI